MAPRWTERRAAELFLTPRRQSRPVPPPPEAAGIVSRPFVLEAAGLRLPVWSWGAGPLVLLAHGWQGSAADMAQLAGAFAQAGYRAVFLELPGHGGGNRRTSLAEWTRALRALAGLLGQPYAVVGHSMGAAAVALALEEGVEARGAVLLAPIVAPMAFAGRFMSFIGLPRERLDGMTRELNRIVGRDVHRFDVRRVARGLRIPSLLVHDPGDAEAPYDEHAGEIAAAWSGCVVEAAPGLGHRGVLTDPGTIARVVRFVDGLRRGGRRTVAVPAVSLATGTGE
ncbi:MAG TPA: alpha/beta hydrolase family protein [Longimicrobiaceae bacterium]